LPWKRTSECVFRKKFPKFELEKLWKTRSKIFVKGKKEKTGDRKETRGVGREIFISFL
jgi:hypothetical protein